MYNVKPMDFVPFGTKITIKLFVVRIIFFLDLWEFQNNCV